MGIFLVNHAISPFLDANSLERVLTYNSFYVNSRAIFPAISRNFDNNLLYIGLKKEQIHSVELVGDATRIPIIQEKIKEVFNVEQPSRTLNSLECVARGCSLQAAMLSPLFKVADYEV